MLYPSHDRLDCTYKPFTARRTALIHQFAYHTHTHAIRRKVYRYQFVKAIMWPSGKSFFSRSSSSKNRDKEERQKENGNGKVKTTPSTPPTRAVERPPRPVNSFSSVPAHIRPSPTQTEKETETLIYSPLGYSGSHRRARSDPNSPPPSSSGYRSDGTSSALPRITITIEETVRYSDGSSGTLTGDHSEDDYESVGKMSLKSLCRPPPGFETPVEKTASTDVIAINKEASDAFMGMFHSQPAPIQARITEIIGTQDHDYHTHYQEFPHADRTADIRLLTSPTTAPNDLQALTPSQYREASKVLHRKKSDWELRKNMLLDSPNHKLYLEDLHQRHADPSEREFLLKFFIVNMLAREGGEIDWSQSTIQQRERNVEHANFCRERREEDGRGVLYSVSGPAVRKKKLQEAEERFRFGELGGGSARLWKRTSLRPELRVRRARTTSMAVTVGGTPTRDYSTLDDVGLGGLSAEQLGGFGLDSPLSEASDRDDAHVDALRFALGPGLSQFDTDRFSTRDFATGTTPSSKPQKEIPSKDPRRQTKTWEPISTTDHYQETLDHQNPLRHSADEKWGSNSDDSGSEDEMTDARERLSEAEIEEARRIIEEAKAKKKKKNEVKEELEKGKDKTSIEKSFPGRSFF